MIVLDTNVLSEVMRPPPSEAVLRWFAMHPAATLFTTTITQAEILFGLALLPEGRRRSDLLMAAEQMFAEDFAGRVLPFDSMAAARPADRSLRCADRRCRSLPRRCLGNQERGGFPGLWGSHHQSMGKLSPSPRKKAGSS
jgi:predicted nucleic acid-binding protein